MSLPRVSFLGLGAMGAPMAGRLLAAGFPLRVWNRTPQRGADLVERGAVAAASPAGAAQGAAFVLTMLRDRAALEAVLFGPDGVLEGLAAEAVLADLSTIGPEAARDIGGRVAQRGRRFVDVPVYGTVGPAAAGTLVMLAGGADADLDALEPVLGVLASRVVRAGALGQGQALKLAINATGTHVLCGVAFGLALAMASGIEGPRFLEALELGAFGSPLARIKGPRMIAGDYAPQFTVDLAIKDLRLAESLARARGVATDSLDRLIELFERASAAGRGGEDLSAVHELLRAPRG